MSSNQGIQFKKLKAILHKHVTCGSCLGLTSGVLVPSATSPCKDAGKTCTSTVCSHYRADTPSLSDSARTSGVLNAVYSTISKMDPRDIEVLGAAFLQAAKVAEAGFRIGQPVWVRVRNAASRNYLSNFAAAWVVNATDKQVWLSSVDGSIRLTYENTGAQGPSIYDEEHFAPLLEMMKKKDAHFDPMSNAAPKMPAEAGFLKPRKQAEGDWDPQTIDKVTRQKPKKRKAVTEYSLVDIVADMNSGHMLATEIDEETGHMELGDNRLTRKVDAETKRPRLLRRKTKVQSVAVTPKRQTTKSRTKGSGVGRVMETGNFIK